MFSIINADLEFKENMIFDFLNLMITNPSIRRKVTLIRIYTKV